jgi:hypothetical protein
VALASIVSPSPLPIQLLSFDGKIVPSGVQLRWSTASEINNDYFDLEKSTGEKFSAIATIKGNGTSFETSNYGFLDTKVTTGKIYYRLKQVDFNGKHTYSNVISVDFDARYSFTVYPNPATGTELNFEIFGVQDTNEVSISLFDELGRKVLSARAQLDEALGSVAGRLPLDKLSNGIYFFRVDGSAIYCKVVVTR